MCNNGEKTIAEIMNMIDNVSGITEREKTETKFKLFSKYIEWTEDDYKKYNELLDELVNIRNELKKQKGKKDKSIVTKSVGDALEDVVDFIFEKSFFYKVHKNKRTSTNEIDQFVVLSNKGKLALADTGFTKDMLISLQEYFLCECKNYSEKVAATWIGKFNTLLEVSGKCSVGLVFSYEGMTGKEDNWYDAHGLTKIIYRLSDDKDRRYILDININDLELLRTKPNNIYEIIQNKKQAMMSNVKSEKFYESNEGKEEVKKIYEELVDT